MTVSRDILASETLDSKRQKTVVAIVEEKSNETKEG